jgi:predicted Fe-Mo cluster-binding NifX family protein
LKIAVSATSGNLDAQIDPRFGRCLYFVIVDPETMKFETIKNTSQSAPSGAGIQAAQIVANTGAEVVLTGNVGPNAFQALSSLGIKIITGVLGTVREAVEKFKSGQLTGTSAPTTPMGFGAGGGSGMGMGRGMGRGGGRGGGRGMGMKRWQTPQYGPQAPTNIPVMPAMQPQMTKEQETQMLENQMKTMQQQLTQIKKRLRELKK